MRFSQRAEHSERHEMSNATQLENLIPMTAVPKLLSTRPCLMTVRRWGFKGLYGIKLRTKKIAGRRFTTEQWVNDFLTAVEEHENRNSRYAERTDVATEMQLRELGL